MASNTSTHPQRKSFVGKPSVEELPTPKPFLKWAGGKRNLMPVLATLLPNKFATYWEPFLGGGAFFFHLISNEEIAGGRKDGGGGALYDPQLSDLNFDLYLTWYAVKNHPRRLIQHLERHKNLHDGNGYYGHIRDLHNMAIKPYVKLRSPVKTAAQTIYLNKTCYNGLYRVNSRGEFNTPRGDYKSPKILDAENIYACSRALKKVDAKISSHSFTEIAPKKGDFVYADPPYDQTFTGYSAKGFVGGDQEKLRDTAYGWHKAGAYVMISNSNTSYIRKLYSGGEWNIKKVDAPRMINSNAAARGNVKELVIRNYK